MSSIDLKKAWNAAINPPTAWQGDLYFYNRIGQKIRYGYAPAQGERKGTIVLTHGYGEHIDLYFETIKKYQKMGYDIWAMDWQGHGKSERDNPDDPYRPSAKGMLRHTHDLDYFVNNIVKTRHDPKTPIIMSTHSMGGHIGLLYLKKFPGVFDSAIMSAPMFDIYRLGMGRWAQPVIRFIFNAASALGFRDKHVPANDEIWEACKSVASKLTNIFRRASPLRGELRELIKKATPEAGLGRPTFGWIAAAFKTIVPSMEEEFLKSIKTPVLIGSAEHEDLVAIDAHERAAKLMPNGTQVKISGAEHGLWFEDDEPFENWWDHITAFLETVKPLNTHEQDCCEDTRKIASGDDLAKTLKGRIVSVKRYPVDEDSGEIIPHDCNEHDGPRPL